MVFLCPFYINIRGNSDIEVPYNQVTSVGYTIPARRSPYDPTIEDWWDAPRSKLGYASRH